MSVFRDFILIVVKVKQRGERSQRFPFNSSEVKREEVSVVSELKQRSERSQMFQMSSVVN